MGGVIGDTLPLGLGIALNPIAIVVGILLLATAGARRNGISFTAGWIAGLTILLLLAPLLVQRRESEDPGTTSTIVPIGHLLVGLVLVLISVRELRGRPRSGARPEPPVWRHLLEQVGVVRAFALGLFLSVVRLKNLALMAAAAGVIGRAGLGTRGILAAVAIFVVICTLGVLVPLLLHLFGGDQAERTLDGWRTWLEANVGAVTAVVMILLGGNLIGKGIGGLF